MPGGSIEEHSDRALGQQPGQVRRNGSGSVALERLSKRFDDGLVAVEDISLRVAPGEFVSIVGPSGCGKSTLLRVIAGLLPKTSGHLAVDGEEVDEPRQDVAMMFQKPTLLPWKTALENVVLPRRLQGGKQREVVHEAGDLLELLGLSGFEHSYPAHLSGGMQQRVALARLLMVGADVLLLDEPFAAVDELTRERLNFELLKIHHEVGATVIFVTHNIAEAAFLSDRVMVMTPRPGRHAETLAVKLPRPRTVEHMRSSEFQDVTFRVRQVLERYEPGTDGALQEAV